MPLSRDFKETVRERAREEPEFRRELLLGSTRLVLNGEVNLGRLILLDYITAMLGFNGLSQIVGTSADDLSEMLLDEPEPDADELLAMIAAIAEHEGIEMDLQPVARDASADLVAA